MYAVGKIFNFIAKTKSYKRLPKILNNDFVKLLPPNYLTKNYSTNDEEIAEEEAKRIDVKQITGDDPQLLHKFKVLQLETEVMRQEGHNVPSDEFILTDHWIELMKMDTRSKRRKYLDFLFIVQKKKENRQEKKVQQRLAREKFLEENKDKPTDGHIIYSLAHNNIFLRFYDSTINHFFNWRLMQAIQFGQKLVVDCGYDENMITRESNNCAKQLMLLFAENRIANDPFDLHFCNSRREGPLMKALYKYIKTMYDPDFPLHIHQKSYLDIFDKKQLIYLTPHCQEEMLEYDHDAIYIIGGIVDKVNNDPLSLAKAKREGLRMQKLPLDRYLQWGAGSGKSLTLNQMISILLDLKNSGNWKYALRHVPRRKIATEDNEIKQGWNHNANRDYSANRNKRVNIRSIFDE